MNKNEQTVMWWVGGIVVVGLIIWGIWWAMQPTTMTTTDNGAGSGAPATTTEQVSTSTATSTD